MRITTWDSDGQKRTPGTMVRVTQKEALRLIGRLTQQIHDNHDGSRLELITTEGPEQYFSVFVEPVPVPAPDPHSMLRRMGWSQAEIDEMLVAQAPEEEISDVVD